MGFSKLLDPSGVEGLNFSSELSPDLVIPLMFAIVQRHMDGMTGNSYPLLCKGFLMCPNIQLSVFWPQWATSNINNGISWHSGNLPALRARNLGDYPYPPGPGRPSRCHSLLTEGSGEMHLCPPQTGDKNKIFNNKHIHRTCFLFTLVNRIDMFGFPYYLDMFFFFRRFKMWLP